MGAETVATLFITAVIVAVLAFFLIAIGLGLQRLSFTIGTIIVGLRAIREQAKPLDGVLNGIVGEVAGIENDLGGVLDAVGAAPASAAAEPMADAVARARGEVVEETDVVEYEDDGAGEATGEVEDDEQYEEYAYEEQPVPEPVMAPFEVPTRSRRGGSGMAEAVARARERIGTRG